MRLNTIKLLTTILSLTGTIALSTGCTKSGFSANSLDASLSGDNSSDKLRRRAPASSTTTTTTLAPVVAPAPTVAQLQLANLPTASDTTASISYSLVPADPSLVVYCRRDSYEPIVCPNPFGLGATTPLSGSHTIDFYVDRGSGINAAAPEISYQWNIVAVAPTPTPATLPPSPTPTTLPAPSGITPLASLPYPVATTMAPLSSPTFNDGDSITGSDGIVRMARVADPSGSGQTVYLHRIVRTDANTNGTHTNVSVRSEKVWIDQNKYMFPGNDYWLAFAFRPKADEWPANTPGLTDDEFLVMQTHSESSGGTSPPISLGIHTGLNQMTWDKSWGAATQAMSNEGNAYLAPQALPTGNVWYKFIIHLRPGYILSQNPRFEVWQAIGSGSYVKIVDDSGPIDYNWNTGSYPRIGFYKWGDTNWSASYPTIAAYLTTLYMGQGLNLYNEAAESLKGIK